MQVLFRLLSAMTRVERIVLLVLSVFLITSFLAMLRLFYVQNTDVVPVKGGTYIEGSIGTMQPINPWFTTSNDVNRDIASLVFAGLMKYNPMTGKIEEDIATLKVSSDNRIYTATVKPGLLWHDSTPQAPHPVTADDVVFTFQTTQDPAFPNPLLHQNYRGVKIEKINDQTVRFTLDKPYAFFLSNLTLGILPKRSFDGIPIKKLDQTQDFGLQPIGCGPYEFINFQQTDLATEVTLKRFPRPGMPEYKIDRMVFRIFPDYSSLLSDIMNINGVRTVLRNDSGKPVLPSRFKPVPYTLPQYVALFFNLDHDMMKDRMLRLGLQLATNKQEIVDTIHESQIVDTPLAEIDLGDWRYKFDAKAAQGALFSSNWNVPEKVRLQLLQEQRQTNAVGPLHAVDRVVLLETGAVLTLTGSLDSAHNQTVFINGIRAESGMTVRNGVKMSMSGSWLVELPAGSHGSGSLKLGMNLVRMTNAKNKVLDSVYIERLTTVPHYEAAVREQRLVDLYEASKAGLIPASQRITIDDLYLETNGYLRRKTAEDVPHTRVNDQGKPLQLTLLTSKTPDAYRKVAQSIKAQWERIGVQVTIEIPDTREDFEQRMLSRNYDMLLFGQSLLDNPDSYPYWHSSQIQERDDPSKLNLDAFNLSQYASFEADALLSRIRETSDSPTRQKLLLQLNDVIKKDVPAIFLYSPLYITASDEGTQGVKIGKLALHSDRLADMNDWYISTERQFKTGKNWLSFPGWVLHFF